MISRQNLIFLRLTSWNLAPKYLKSTPEIIIGKICFLAPIKWNIPLKLENESDKI